MIQKYQLSEEQLESWLKNLLKFTAPILGIFFAQLAMGVEFEAAGFVALYAFYALLADYFKKLN